MRKIFILAIVILSAANSFAQRSLSVHPEPVNVINPYSNSLPGNAAAKTTGIGDTVKLSYIADTAPVAVYRLGSRDSGYVTGTDYWNDQAFAERYNFNNADSSIKVIGLFALFGGTVNPASTKTINFNIWNQGASVAIADTLLYNGFPESVLNFITVPVTQLGIGPSTDTMKRYFFDSATAFGSGPFFVGYNIGYSFSALNGDTIGLVSSINGTRTGIGRYFTMNVVDGDTVITTVINVQNATRSSDYHWHDNYTDNDSLYNNLAIFPIVVVGNPTGVSGVTRNDLTFFGNYPNPAVNSTNIRFSLLAVADVSIRIMDINGRTVNTIKQSGLSAGEHVVPVNTSGLPAGDYLYLIRTSAGDGVAGKMTVRR